MTDETIIAVVKEVCSAAVYCVFWYSLLRGLPIQIRRDKNE